MSYRIVLCVHWIDKFLFCSKATYMKKVKKVCKDQELKQSEPKFSTQKKTGNN